MKNLFLLIGSILFFGSCSTIGQSNFPQKDQPIISAQGDTLRPILKSDKEWKKELSPKSYFVLRENGTERAFSGKWLKNKTAGQYVCAACKLPLFSSDTKFKSGSGWPSFYDSIDKSYVKEIGDYSQGMDRIELRCARCNGHLGHVFNDGPKPTGQRYCINSVSLDFVPKK